MASKKVLASVLVSIILVVYPVNLPAITKPISSSDDVHLPGSISASAVEELTRQILRKELELERLNTMFRQQTATVSPWRQRRMFAYGEGNALLTASGLILALPVDSQMANARRGTTSTGKSQGSLLAASDRCLLLANAYSMGGDLLEMGLNFVHYCSLRKKGFVPSMYRQRVHKLHAEIDSLIGQRNQALEQASNFSAPDKTLADAEGKLLADLRDLYLLEYIDYHAGTKRFWVAQNAAYLTDIARAATGMAANLIDLASNHRGRLAMDGGAGVLTVISGVIILLVPFVGRVTGNVSGLAARRIVSPEAADVHASSVETYSSDLAKFLAMGGNKIDRQSLYQDQEKIMLMRNQFFKKEQKEAHDTLIENVVFAGIVGPTKVTTGVTSIIAGWHYADNIPTAGKLYVAGNTTFLAGTGFNILETARVQAAIELSNWKLRDSDLLPSNQFNRRLRMLDNMDSLLGK